MTTVEQERLNVDILSDQTEVRIAALKRMDDLARAREVDASALPGLISLLRSSYVVDRQKASRLVAKLAQNQVEAFWPFDDLNELTKDKNAEVRENAAWALGELAGMRVGVHSSIPYLTDLLQDREGMVRGMAAWALGQFGEHLHMWSPLTVERLDKLAYDRSPFVSKSAAYALEIMRG